MIFLFLLFFVYLGMVVIGDEILNGFTAETNMAVAAKSLGKRFYKLCNINHMVLITFC